MELGWLDREGNFTQCERQAHISVAEKICKENGLWRSKSDPLSSIPCDERLMSFGYVHITIDLFFEREYLLLYDRWLTPEQKSFLKDWIERHDASENEFPINEIQRSAVLAEIEGRYAGKQDN